MKTLDLSLVTPSVGIIIQKDTLTHVTDSYEDAFDTLVKSLIPSGSYTGKLVILYGCVATGTNPGARTLTAGAVYYNGEIYQVPAASFSTTGSEIGIWTLTDLNAGSTESKFTDGSDAHVLVNNVFVFADGLSGTGTFDETSTNVVRLFDSISTIPSFNNPYVNPLVISSFELNRIGKLVTISISGGITLDSTMATTVNTTWLEWIITLPTGIPDRTVIGSGNAFSPTGGGSPYYKTAQIYSEKLSGTTISFRLVSGVVCAAADAFQFTFNASYKCTS